MLIQDQMYDRAKNVLVGGCTAGGRYYGDINRPLYIQSANGSRITDCDGKEYIDYHTNSGAGMFGYNHPRIRKAVEKGMDMGFFCNWETKYHAEMAELLCEVFPSAEKVRLANSGTEATMGAIRIARAYTGRTKLIKFEGHFHGMHELVWYNHTMVADVIDDSGEVKSMTDTAGTPRELDSTVINVPFNNVEALENAVKKYAGEVACIILEPISFNCGCYEPTKGFLEEVRKICDREGIVLIFDEVITGLRMRPGSAQAYYNVMPDLTTTAKAVGGGFQNAVVMGKAKIMDVLGPVGNVTMSGTYTGSLIPVLVTIECLKMAKESWFYDHVDNISEKLYGGINSLMETHGIKGHARGVGARFAIYFGVENQDVIHDYRKVALEYDPIAALEFTRGSMERGIFMLDGGKGFYPPHRGFSIQHTVEDINETLEKFEDIFKKMKK